jgi:hypothetical protein
MKTRSSVFIGVVAAAILSGMTALSAQADTFNFTLGTSNIGGLTGPFVNVLVDLTSTKTATFTFTSLTNSGDIFLLGGNGAVAVNINAGSWTLSTISVSNAGSGFTPGPWSNGGAANEDGFGRFNQTIDSFDGYTHSSDTISFSVTRGKGNWATAADVLKANADGYTAAAHIFVTTSPADSSNGAIITGYATNGSVGTPVPLPAAVWGGMSMLGLLGVGSRLRKRLQK